MIADVRTMKPMDAHAMPKSHRLRPRLALSRHADVWSPLVIATVLSNLSGNMARTTTVQIHSMKYKKMREHSSKTIIIEY